MTDEARAGEPRTEAGRRILDNPVVFEGSREWMRQRIIEVEREAAAELWQQGYAAGLERGRQPDNHPAPSRDGFEAQLAEALPWVIVPLSDPEDPLAMMRWTDDQGKQPDWRMVARRLRERLEAQGRLSESAPPVAPLGEE